MYLRNNKDPQFKIGVLSSQWLLKHSVCIRVAKSEHWTPSSPLPWDLAFHLNIFSNYYSALQSISAIYHTLLAQLHKKTALHVQTTKMEGECSKGCAIQNSTWKRGTYARKSHASRARQNACKRVKKSFIYFAIYSEIVSNYASMFGGLIILITHLWIS